MKKISLLAFALILAVGTLVAQPGRSNRANYSPETRAMMRLDALASTVELSKSERTQVLELFTSQEKERATKRAQMDLQREQRRAEMEASKAKTDASLKKIIGDEKFAKYEAARAEKKEVVEEKLNAFDEMVYISKCHRGSLRYPTIKKWFLKEYPDVAKFGTVELSEEAQEEETKTQSVIPMPESQTEKKTA